MSHPPGWSIAFLLALVVGGVALNLWAESQESNEANGAEAALST